MGIDEKIIDKAYGAVTTPVEVLLLCAVLALATLLYLCSRKYITLVIENTKATERNTAVLEALKETMREISRRSGRD